MSKDPLACNVAESHRVSTFTNVSDAIDGKHGVSQSADCRLRYLLATMIRADDKREMNRKHEYKSVRTEIRPDPSFPSDVIRFNERTKKRTCLVAVKLPRHMRAIRHGILGRDADDITE